MKIWQKFKYAIFDIDGTIFDNLEISADAFFQTLKKFKDEFPDKARTVYLETNGMNLDDQFELVFRLAGIKRGQSDIKKLHRKFFRLRDNSSAWKKSPLFPGVISCLDKLSKKGIKILASSGSKTAEVKFRLKKAGILKNFSLILGGDKFPKGQKHISKAAEYFRAAPRIFSQKAFLVSDGANDMRLAKKAGIFAIGVTNTLKKGKLKSAGADLTIKTVRDLLTRNF